MLPNSRLKLLLLPFGLICLLLLVLPLLSLFARTTPEGIFEALLDREVVDSIVLTFGCALAATLLGILLGTPLAFLLSRPDVPQRHFLQGLVDLPLVVPHPVAGIALLLAFSVAGFPAYPVGRWSGIVVAMFFVSAPLLIDSLREGFRAVPGEMEWTARSLGVGPVATFFRVTLPLVRNHLLAGALMMWARSISEFGAIIILVYNPKVISVLIYDRFTSHGLGMALPVAIILLLATITVFVCLRVLQRRSGWVAGGTQT